jgi:transcriptional regulator with XRE-family HTH domain
MNFLMLITLENVNSFEPEPFGEWMKSLREAHKPPWTQEEMGEQLGFDQAMISKIEKGLKPSGDFCIAVAVHEGLPFDFVLRKAGLIEGGNTDATTTEEEAMLQRSLKRFKSPEARARAIAAAMAVLDSLAETESKDQRASATASRPATRRPAAG